MPEAKRGAEAPRRVCVGIRAHRYGEAERELHELLSRCFRVEDVFFVFDETNAPVETPAGVRRTGFDRAALREAGLFCEAPRIGWLCGDYAYYFLRRAVRARHYWLIEPDVRFTHRDPKDFFRCFEHDDADLALCLFGKRNGAWMWHAAALQVAPEVHGCAFPLSRASGKAIDALYRERHALSQSLAARGAGVAEWPNDESFVATAAVKLGLRCLDIASVTRHEVFSHFSVLHPWLWPDARDVVPPDRVLHPAVLAADFPAAFDKYARSALGRSAPLRQVLDAALAAGDAKHRTAVRTQLLAAVGGWFDTLPCAQRAAPARIVSPAPAVAQGAVAVTRHAVLARAKQTLALAAPGDFTLGEGERLAPEALDFARYTPYCFDYATDAYLFVDTPRSALDEPFLYQAQFTHATEVLRVPRALLAERLGQAGAPPAQQPPLLVFSIGRCGSTLFSRLCAACGITSFSEPDVFSALATAQRHDPRSPEIIGAAMAALTHFAGDGTRGICVKFRSGTNAAIGDFLAAFPTARYLFIRRELRAWAASFIAKFNWSTDQLVGSLLGAHQALQTLESSAARFDLLDYESFAADPLEVWRRVGDGSGVPAEIAVALHAIAAQDAQSGADLRARHAGAARLRERVRDFLVAWKQSAPPAARRRFVIAAARPRAAGAPSGADTAAPGGGEHAGATALPRDFAFIHINKTGGSSIEAALGLELEHLTAQEKLRQLGRAEWQRRFTFTVVRNPWDKVLSHFRYRVQTNQSGLRDAGMSFARWVELAYGLRDPRYYDQPRMFMPQWRWIVDAQGRVLVDYICRFENLEADFAEVCRRIGRAASLPHVKSSIGGERGPYRERYDERTAAIVAERFREDTEHFGYTF
ncbi:MAG: hypothetical protein CALGDGBN_01199 [Pseudomonadales bacterium]|nr:hypothetical protein [Pseudomonadales bacterium]